MPANLFTETLPVNSNLEDQRALHLAFELSMLGLDEDDGSNVNVISEADAEILKKNNGANMTECVPVPSSEHVAEIVGRQGCKIKALRAKTNTYIKTPVRGEEPVFVVTGRKEDVCLAKREILSAAEHFSQIRASRRNSSVSSNGSLMGPPSPSAPGQVTIQVRVPYKVVGLVVGPKGATIKRIQQQTHTYIVTPSRDKEPVFEVTGLPENVEKAKVEIESHIAIRTGGQVEGPDDDFHSNGVDSGFHELNGNSFVTYNKNLNAFNTFTDFHNTINGSKLLSDRNVFNFPPISKISDFASLTMNTGFSGFGMYDNDEGIGGSPQFDHMPPSSSIWPDALTSFGSSAYPRRGSSLGSAASQHSLSPPLTDSNSQSSGQNSPPSPVSDLLVRQINNDFLSTRTTTVSTAFGNITTTASCIPTSDILSSNSISASIISNVVDSPKSMGGVSCPVKVPTLNGRPHRHCLMCSESDIVAALVPCGHNLFCMECASLIVQKPVLDRLCPVCNQTPTQAIRIFS